MEKLKQFVQVLRTTHAGPGIRGELDVEEIFPIIPRSLVATALHDLWTALCASRHVPKNGLFFHINKGGLRELDFVGGQSKKDSSFHHLSSDELLSIVVWDLAWNGCLSTLAVFFASGRACTSVALPPPSTPASS